MEEGTSKSVGHIRGTEDACPSAELACEVRRILDRIADKWSLLVISLLGQNTLRFSELRRQIDGISQRMLTLTLRNLERDGLVSRTVYPVVPPKVEYRLTTLGVTLIDPIRALVSWTSEHQDEIRTARDAYDTTEASSDHDATKSAAS
jgi:DNA-binding HxlR family transcriptional regulator